MRDQTGPFGLLGVHHAAGEDEVHGLGLAHRAGMRWVPPAPE
jgi:hypothetical protein